MSGCANCTAYAPSGHFCLNCAEYLHRGRFGPGYDVDRVLTFFVCSDDITEDQAEYENNVRNWCHDQGIIPREVEAIPNPPTLSRQSAIGGPQSIVVTPHFFEEPIENKEPYWSSDDEEKENKDNSPPYSPSSLSSLSATSLTVIYPSSPCSSTASTLSALGEFIDSP
jgi:hypothetical protein